MSRSGEASESGVVLVLILWVLALITAIVLGWAQEWRSEIRLAANFRGTQISRNLAEAGIYYALFKLEEVRQFRRGRGEEPDDSPRILWQGDQELHVLELPGGQVEIRVDDEAGKVNLNRANEQILTNLLATLGYKGDTLQTIVASIQDWRDNDNLTRLHGAERDYYLSLKPPYIPQDGPFVTVEELAWVRGLGQTPLLPQFSKWLTVQKTAYINVNTAPLPVLEALGLSGDQARTVIEARSAAPLRQKRDLPIFSQDQTSREFRQPLGFRPSPFYTIVARGISQNPRAQHVIKAIVRIMHSKTTPWEILYWADTYPG